MVDMKKLDSDDVIRWAEGLMERMSRAEVGELSAREVALAERVVSVAAAFGRYTGARDEPQEPDAYVLVPGDSDSPDGGNDAGDACAAAFGVFASPAGAREFGENRLAAQGVYRVAPLRGPLASFADQGVWLRSDLSRLQSRATSWAMTCFGSGLDRDPPERIYRFLEEALELVQACGCTREEVAFFVDFVFSHTVGEVSQEVAGSVLTLAILASAWGLDMSACAEAELARLWCDMDKIRARQARKPRPR